MKGNLFRLWDSYWWMVVILVLHTGALFSACSSGIGDHIRMHREMKAYAKEHRDEIDFSNRRSSGDGMYLVSFEPQTDPVPMGRMHQWTIHVMTADSVAVDDAEILVDGGMPEHGHGLPTNPQVTQALGDGRYMVEGLKFQMPGWWIVRFDVSSAYGADRVVFDLML